MFEVLEMEWRSWWRLLRRESLMQRMRGWRSAGSATRGKWKKVMEDLGSFIRRSGAILFFSYT
ncbi:uncharacterized protein DS421_10g313290 [Arachis hypogaea]|nr:uncharacterized protein DS421_10g313290 [Arachis hypogaea]